MTTHNVRTIWCKDGVIRYYCTCGEVMHDPQEAHEHEVEALKKLRCPVTNDPAVAATLHNEGYGVGLAEAYADSATRMSDGSLRITTVKPSHLHDAAKLVGAPAGLHPHHRPFHAPVLTEEHLFKTFHDIRNEGAKIRVDPPPTPGPGPAALTNYRKPENDVRVPED